MKISTLFWIVVIVLIISWKACYHPTFPSMAKEYLSSYAPGDDTNIRSTPNPCVGKDHCVYIYLAPWCPYCQETVTNIRDYRNFWNAKDRPGLMVIVGNDKNEAIQAMAAKIGVPVFLDSQNKFLKQLRIHSFPTYIIVDKQQRIISRNSQWVADEINAHLRNNGTH